AARAEQIDRIVGDALDQQAKLFLTGAKFCFRLYALGEVAGDLGKAGEPSGLVANRVDHHMGPEAAAILAHPPAFAFELAFAGGNLQDLCRQALGAVFRGIKTREMLPDDLVGRVALETLRPGIPAYDKARWIQHV